MGQLTSSPLRVFEAGTKDPSTGVETISAYINDNGDSSFSGGGGGSSTFVGLSDTPTDYVASAGKVLQINSGATAVEFSDSPTLSSLTVSSSATFPNNSVSIGQNLDFTGGKANFRNLADLQLGTDRVDRGNSGDSRALVKDNGSTLAINYQGDYTNGVRIDGTKVDMRTDLIVTGSVNFAELPYNKLLASTVLTSVSSLSLPTLFSDNSGKGYNTFRIKVAFTGSVSGDVRMNLIKSGVPDTTTNYTSALTLGNATRDEPGQTYWIITNNITSGFLDIEVSNPYGGIFPSFFAKVQGQASGAFASGTSTGNHSIDTGFDGITITFPGSVSGYHNVSAMN